MKGLNCEECPFSGDQIAGEGYIVEGDKVLVCTDNQFDVVGVGMAPAYVELQQGRPFVGPSGSFLRKTLNQLGVKKYYLTNVLRCQIPDGATEEQKAQAELCCHDVIEEVNSKKPKLTIGFGDMPLHIFTDLKYGIKECEGRIVPSKVGAYLPITHPAYYLRNQPEAFDFIECSRAGIRFLDGVYEQAKEPNFEIVNPDNLDEIRNKVDKYKELGVDTETTGFHAYGWDPDHLLEMGLAVSPEQAYIVPAEYIPEFKEILETKEGVYWNAQFDASFLKCVGVNPKVTYDGMLAHYTIDERPYSHGLKRCARIYLGADDWEKELDTWIPKRAKKTVSYEVVPKDVRYQYLAKDCTRTLQLKTALEPDLNHRVFDTLLMPACRMFIDIAHRGQRIHPGKIMKMDEYLTKALADMDHQIYELTGKYLNPKSPKEVSSYLFGELGLPPQADGGTSTGKAILEQYREVYPIVDIILEYRELAKLKGTYIEGFGRHVDRNFRIHPSIKLFGSITGRLSSENPSIMNVKSLGKLKEIFLPDEGKVMLYSDVKGNELRGYCIISGDKDLTQILKEGGDPHEVVRLAAYGECEDKDEKKHQRMLAKAVVFGRIYKRGRNSIEQQVGSGVIDQVMAAVDDVAPSIDKYYKMIISQVKKQGYIETPFGRKRKFILLDQNTLKDIEREAVNFPIQSYGSDIMLFNFLHLWENKDKWGIFPYWPYHDSITMDADDPKILPEIRKEMEGYTKELVNDAMPFIWEMNWGQDWRMASSDIVWDLDEMKGIAQYQEYLTTHD